MDPPSLGEEIPEPKSRLDPEESFEMPDEPPPAPPAVAMSIPVATSPPKEPMQDEKKDESTAAAAAPQAGTETETETETETAPSSPKTEIKDGSQQLESSGPPPPPPPPLSSDSIIPPTTPPAVPPSPSGEAQMPLSPKERTTSFDELRSYEAKRRSIYLKKLKSSSLYWRAFRDTLSKSYRETERAEILVQGSVVANQKYGEYLSAAAEDRLDYAGKPVVEERRARKMQADKNKKYDSLGGGSLLWGIAAAQERKKEEEEKKKKLESVNGGSSVVIGAAGQVVEQGSSFDGAGAEDTVLATFINAHQQMADKFNENCTFVKDVCLEKLTALRKELEAEVNVMSMLGDVTIFELEKAEDDVQKAWAAYYTLASMTVGSVSNRPRPRPAGDKSAVMDVWLVEMHYRMSVAYLTTVWEKCSKELSNLFSSMKELECNRRFRLSELMIVYMQRAERLWLSIPSVITAVTKDLVSAPTDTDSIEKEVQITIRDKAQAYQKKDMTAMKSDPMNAPGLAGVPDLKEGYELQSPLNSDLLGKTQVVWRKNEKLMSVWKPTLAMATTDCYLHLFDIPHFSNVQTGTAPEVAFQALVPPVRIPTEDDMVNGTYPFGNNWFDHLVPTDSIDLRCTKITFSESKGSSTFEVTETLAPNKISTVSNFTRKKKLALRMYSSQHMVEWLLALKNYGAE